MAWLTLPSAVKFYTLEFATLQYLCAQFYFDTYNELFFLAVIQYCWNELTLFIAGPSPCNDVISDQSDCSLDVRICPVWYKCICGAWMAYKSFSTMNTLSLLLSRMVCITKYSFYMVFVISFILCRPYIIFTDGRWELYIDATSDKWCHDTLLDNLLMPSKSKTDLTKMIGCEWITDLGDSVFINGSGSSCIQKKEEAKTLSYESSIWYIIWCYSTVNTRGCRHLWSVYTCYVIVVLQSWLGP